eukprot:gene21820-26256_t
MAERQWTAVLRVVGAGMAERRRWTAMLCVLVDVAYVAGRVSEDGLVLKVRLRNGCDPAPRARGARGAWCVADRANEVGIVLK